MRSATTYVLHICVHAETCIYIYIHIHIHKTEDQVVMCTTQTLESSARKQIKTDEAQRLDALAQGKQLYKNIT